MIIRKKYFWMLDLLKRTPQEQYFLFDPSRMFANPPYEEDVRKDFYWDYFEDWEYYRASADMLRGGISLLNEYLYGWMIGKYTTHQKFNQPQYKMLLQIYQCLSGILGIHSSMEPYIPDPMRRALFEQIRLFKPRNTIIKYSGGSRTSNSRRAYGDIVPLNLMGDNVMRYINESDFPRALFPHEPSENPSTTLKEIRWQPDHRLTQHEYYSRIRLCRALLGAGGGTELYTLTLEDIPTTIADCSLLQGIRQLAAYIGMPQHERDKLIEWKEKIWTQQDIELAGFMIGVVADKTERVDKERNRELQKTCVGYWNKYKALTIPIPMYHKGKIQNTNQFEDNYRKMVFKRALGQMFELQRIAMWLFYLAGAGLQQQPVRLQSNKYDETLKVERTQQDLINEMAIELGRLPRFNAYYKIIEEREDRQMVVSGKMQTLPLPAETVRADADIMTIAKKAVHPLCKERTKIEAEIYERQEKWRRIESSQQDKQPDTPSSEPAEAPPPPTRF
jgi:hypothetical protein